MMEIKREYKYDNIKCIMIFCVVFAHLLITIVGNLSYNMYIFIYTFHMPMFAYVSGYFSKGSTKSINKNIYIYLIWQTIYYFFDLLVLGINEKFTLITPNYVLWYIFAMLTWNLLIKVFNKLYIKYYLHAVIISFIVSLLSGFFPFVGYELSVGRIITFFPYFLIGYIHKNVKDREYEITDKSRKILISIFAIVSIGYFIKNINIIEYWWVYGATQYIFNSYNIIFKMMWIILSLVELYLIYKIVPNKKINVVSNIGQNTLNIFLLHALVIKWLRVYGQHYFCYTEIINIVLSAILTCILLVVFSSKFVKNNIIYLTDVYKIIEKIIIKKKPKLLLPEKIE